MEPSSPDALHPGESSESQAFYRSQVTLGLSSWQPVPRFARLTALLVGVFQKTPGAVKLTPGRRQFTSHSVWRDSDAAQEFFKSPEHREAIRRAYAGMTNEFYVIPPPWTASRSATERARRASRPSPRIVGRPPPRRARAMRRML
jgi:hypothetical protein